MLYIFPFRWEDSLNNSIGGESVTRSNNSRASNTSRYRGRGRGSQNRPNTASATFVSATGDPISGRRCFVCGDPSHFANVCPNRG